MKFALVLICCILIPSTFSELIENIDELGEDEYKDDESSEETSGPKEDMKSGKFENDCLKAHNKYRIKHGVPKLVLSKEISAYSKEWADQLAATDSFNHRDEGKYGENLFKSESHMVPGNEPVDSWYDEIEHYVFGSEPKNLKTVGHFTQVIWKESKSLGCAWARNKRGHIIVVANYDPPGNVVGNFAQNVPAPKK